MKHLSWLLLLAVPAQAAPLFQDATSRLGAPQPCASTHEGCYSNYTLLADLTGDGALDVVFANGGAYYQPGEAEPLAFYVGRGDGTFVESNATLLGGFTGRLRQVAAGDIDGDGDLDLLAPDSWALQPDALFINQGGRFVDEGPLRLGTSSRAGAARMGDVDGDGDLDLVVSDWGQQPPDSPGTAHIYLNDGLGFFDERPAAVPTSSSTVGTGPVDLDLFDADGDFDLDLLLASREGDSLLFFNNGQGDFTFVDAALPPQPGPYTYGPDVCDVDGDTRLDLWMDNGQTGLKEQLLIGAAGVFTDRTRQQVASTANSRDDDNEVQCVDIDHDGDLDAVVASLSGNERVLLNSGAGTFTALSGAFPRVSDSTLGLDVGDVNADGRLDVVTAQGETGSFLNHLYLGTTNARVDTQPPRIRAQTALPAGSGALRVVVAWVDGSTTDVGPRLSRVEITQGDRRLPLHFAGGDLFSTHLSGPSGSTATLTPCATDAAGNTTCGAPFAVKFP